MKTYVLAIKQPAVGGTGSVITAGILSIHLSIKENIFKRVPAVKQAR